MAAGAEAANDWLYVSYEQQRARDKTSISLSLPDLCGRHLANQLDGHDLLWHKDVVTWTKADDPTLDKTLLRQMHAHCKEQSDTLQRLNTEVERSSIAVTALQTEAKQAEEQWEARVQTEEQKQREAVDTLQRQVMQAVSFLEEARAQLREEGGAREQERVAAARQRDEQQQRLEEMERSLDRERADYTERLRGAAAAVSSATVAARAEEEAQLRLQLQAESAAAERRDAELAQLMSNSVQAEERARRAEDRARAAEDRARRVEAQASEAQGRLDQQLRVTTEADKANRLAAQTAKAAEAVALRQVEKANKKLEDAFATVASQKQQLLRIASATSQQDDVVQHEEHKQQRQWPQQMARQPPPTPKELLDQRLVELGEPGKLLKEVRPDGSERAIRLHLAQSKASSAISLCWSAGKSSAKETLALSSRASAVAGIASSKSAYQRDGRAVTVKEGSSKKELWMLCDSQADADMWLETLRHATRL